MSLDKSQGENITEASTSNNPLTDQPSTSNEECATVLPEAEKLRQSIVNYVDRNDLKEMFWGMHSPFRAVDEVLCIQAATILSRMDENNKYAVVHYLVSLVNEARTEECTTVEMYERIVDSIFRYLIGADILSPGIGLVAIILTADNTLKSAISTEKWKFISENWEKLDMKSIRIIFKTLIDWQKQLPIQLSCAQRRQLIPVEELLLSMLSTVPPIFTMTELYQHKGDVYLHYFPRVVEKIAQIKAYFRPMADLVFVVGRSLMYPILAHPQFLANSSSWKVDRNRTMLFSRLTYLPNRKEVSSEQTYLFHMVFKQPRGKDALVIMLRQVDRPAVAYVFEQLLSLLINETMAAVEDLPQDEDMPRYMWDHLLTVIVYATQHEITSTSGVVRILHKILEKVQYRRARDEVMWLLLQIVGSFNQQLSAEVIEQMAALHKLLYNEDTSYTVATDHPTQMVRFLSTACMYILLEGKNLPPPTDSLASQINFIRDLAARETIEIPMMAILANAYRTDQFRRVLLAYGGDLEGQANEEQFTLSYGRMTNHKLDPLSIQLTDSLAMRAKLHMLSLFHNSFAKPRERLPTPAFIETFARIYYTMDFDYGMKSFGQTLSRSASQANHMGTLEQSRDMLYIILDLFSNRLTNVPIPGTFRQTICLTVISIMNLLNGSNTLTYLTLDLQYICEQALMRIFAWTPVNEIIPFCIQLIGRGSDRSVAMHICQPHMFTDPPASQTIDSKNFHVCPELVRVLFIAMLRTAKILSLDFSDESAFFKHISSVFKWTPSQIRSFPAVCRSHKIMIDETTNCDLSPEMANEIHSDYTQMRGLPEQSFVEYMTMPDRKPTLLCVIYRAIFENEDRQMYTAFYTVLGRLSTRILSVSLNWLVDYVIHQVNDSMAVTGTDAPTAAVNVLKTMAFQRHMMPFDRLLMTMVLHPNNDQKSQIALLLIKNILDSSEVQERISFFCVNVPRKEANPVKFFEELSLYHKKFPEFTFQEMATAATQGTDPVVNPKCHPPIFYGSLIERLVPIVDFTLGRALEIELVDAYLSTYLKVLSPVYKYHPAPISFVYSLLHSQHEILGHTQRARQFVIAIFSPREDVKLTEKFVTYNHQKMSSLEDLLTELITRVVECSEFLVKPPAYVTQDWRMAELAPAAQALYLSCIELMASPHAPAVLVPAMVSLLCSSSLARSRPYTTLNAIALLLTALPVAYAKQLQNMFAEVFDQHSPNEISFEDIVYDNFEENILLHMTNRPMIINAMLQAYWHHGNQLSIANFTTFFLEEIYKKITTEKELWYFIRLMVPLQQWVFEAKIKHHYTECIAQARGLLKKTGELAEAGVEFEHGEELCDLFYHLKYMCVGDALTQEAEEIFPKLPPKMRERFKYYARGSKGDDDPGPKMSTVIRPDVNSLVKSESDASERIQMDVVYNRESEEALVSSWRQQMDQTRKCPWYWGPLTWKDAERLLDLCDPGTFLVRDSTHENYCFTVSFRVKDGKVRHSRVTPGPQNLFAMAVRNKNCYNITGIVQAMVKATESDDHHVLMHRRGLEAEAERVYLTKPLSRVAVLPSLQYLCRLSLRLCGSCNELPANSIPRPVKSYLMSSDYLIPDIMECIRVLKKQ